LPTKSQLQVRYLSTTFLTSLALTSFLVEVKQTFTNFPMAHRNLGSSRAMPCRLGGFTSKSNNYHNDFFTKLKCSSTKSLTKRNLSTQAWIYYKSLKPHKVVLGRAQKGFRMSIFVGGTSGLQRSEGESFYTCPPKTSRWELISRNWNIRFENRNIQNWKYSCYRKNRILQFGKPNCLVFLGSVRYVVYEAIVFSLISLGFLGYVSIETLLAIHVVSLLIEQQPILQINYKINSFNLSLHQY
jgi:hypothetical protein